MAISQDRPDYRALLYFSRHGVETADDMTDRECALALRVLLDAVRSGQARISHADPAKDILISYNPLKPPEGSAKGPIEQLRDLVKIQCQDGNWNYDHYMLGMANGLILALATLEKQTPVYKEWPDDTTKP